MTAASDMVLRQEVLEAYDGLALFAESYVGKSMKGVVVLLHGYAEHVGRYQHVIRFLGEHGYGVYTYDTRGHGKSPGERALLVSFDELMDDLDLMMARVRDRHPDSPLFLLGHSMGGGLATLFVLTRKPLINGLVLSSPLLRLKDQSPFWLRALAPWLAKLMPRLEVAPGPLPADLANDPRVGEAFREDRLCYHDKVRLATGAAFLAATKQIARQQENLNCPLLILQGADDRIVDITGAAALEEAAMSYDKTLRMVPHMGHEIFNEPEAEEVLDELVRWMDGHLVLAERELAAED